MKIVQDWRMGYVGIDVEHDDNYYNEAGNLMLAKGKLKTAADLYMRALNINPKNEDARDNLEAALEMMPEKNPMERIKFR